jgi:hypothetical protein
LFTAADRTALQQKARANPELWKPVLNSAKGLAKVPTGDAIKAGAKYWKIEGVESGALAYFVTGDKKYLDDVVKWMLAHCQQPVWGTGFRDNVDLQASWNLYHLSLAYDIIGGGHDDIPDADRKIIVDGLTSHAKAIYDSFDPNAPERKGKFPYDQNHTYIPAVALTAASLTLVGEVPEANDWLKRAYAVMNRCRYVQGEDGYYYEGYGYWSYALHWQARYADLISRATGKPAFDLPALHDSWRFALQLSLPGNPGAFDIHDSNQWKGDKRPNLRTTNYGYYWQIARVDAARGETEAAGDNKTVADMYYKRAPDLDYPAAEFLWYAPEVPATPLEKITPYHYFADHDVVTWRSGWDADATALLFRCGPPEGHAAAAKLKQLTDWSPNAGHVHPDIGAFYLFAKGANLAVSTGYTAEKWTRDHNTLLVDGKGQGADGTYHNDHGVPYDQLNECKITRQWLSNDYAFVSGQFGAAYTQTPNSIHLQRSLLATKRYLLVIDDMHSESAHKLTWFVHSDAPFKQDGKAYVAKQAKASLAVIPLAPADLEAVSEPTKVMAGMAPGKGVETQRGHHLSLAMKQGEKAVRLVNLLVPLAADETLPTVESTKLDGDTLTFVIRWADNKTEKIDIAMQASAKEASPRPPVTISTN